MEPRHGIMKAFPKVKRAKVLQRTDAPPLKKKLEESDVTGILFSCLHTKAVVSETNLGLARKKYKDVLGENIKKKPHNVCLQKLMQHSVFVHCELLCFRKYI